MEKEIFSVIKQKKGSFSSSGGLTQKNQSLCKVEKAIMERNVKNRVHCMSLESLKLTWNSL